MNIGSRILLGLLAAAVITSGLFTYWNTMIAHNFVIINDVEEEGEEEESEETVEEASPLIDAGSETDVVEEEPN